MPDFIARYGWTFPLFFVAFLLYEAYQHGMERRSRQEVMAHGKDAVALAEQSTGLEFVALSWIDATGETRTGEARTRKQVSGRQYVGRRFEIKYAATPALRPVIVSEAAHGDDENTFWIRSNLLVSVAILAFVLLTQRARLRPWFRR